MTDLVRGVLDEIESYAEIYLLAYEQAPWHEKYDFPDVMAYIEAFLRDGGRMCFVLREDDEPVGMALGIIVPNPEGNYLRLEDFLIHPQKHREGYGSRMLDLLFDRIESMGIDSILLNTQRNFPAHYFYLHNGFREVESVLLMKTRK
ncbi:MAG: GNAT family N-acetyltransferase [Tissierellia bacterium]|mgnify:CR=1 FL=1|jgi:aminoglycoside 6'-N-acetyltransferase I|nr:GNAT family N-acetyltransferase [Tissierellia bacterium]